MAILGRMFLGLVAVIGWLVLVLVSVLWIGEESGLVGRLVLATILLVAAALALAAGRARSVA